MNQKRQCDNCCEPIALEATQSFAGLELCPKCQDEERIRRAAPDLLAALETSVRAWENSEKEKPLGKSKFAFAPIWVLDARAAISKAKGNS